MPAALAAAHVGHQIEHSSALFGFIAGAVVGLAIGVVAVVAVVATGGAALAVIAAVGGAVAATGGMALTGKYIGEGYKNPSGPIAAGSPNVLFGPMRMPAARTAIDLVTCKNHGPQMIALGSDSVFINTFPSARKDDKTVCDGTVGSLMDHIFIGAETAQYLEIQSEVPDWAVQLAQGMVIVGTAVALVFGAAAAAVAGGICGVISFAGTTVGGFAGGFIGAIAGGNIGEALGGDIGRRWGEAVGGLAGGLFGARLGNRMATGHPIDVATGELFTSERDFTLAGLIPVVWERYWNSGSTQNGTLGHKWHHSYDMMIAEGTDHTVLRMEQGRLIALPPLFAGDHFYHRAEKLTVLRDASGYRVLTQDKQQLRFAPSPTDPSRFLLQQIGDLNGNALELDYDSAGLLQRITNCAGVMLLFAHDTAGRITAISRASGDLREQLVHYRYSAQGDLADAVNATGVPFAYHYDQHLIIQETRRSGLSFYFEWDDPAKGGTARCIKTWGDDNLYFRAITYDLDERKTTVLDSRGGTSIYFSNPNGLVTKIISPLGVETQQTYSVYGELLERKDGEGNSEKAGFDAFGRLIEEVQSDGATTCLSYAIHDPTQPNFHSVACETNPLGAETRFTYDTQGNIATVSDPLRNWMGYLRNERGLPLVLRDEEGTISRFQWSQGGELLRERRALGGEVAYEYDAFGRITAEKLARESETRYRYDALDQVAEVTHANGGVTRIASDVEGNIAELTDPAGRRTAWHYGTLPFPQQRTNPDGSRFHYRYDSELNLIGLQNEVGETYRLDHDADGNLVREIGFDGREQTYRYNAAGHVIAATDGHREHSYTRDAMGRLTARTSSDGLQAAYSFDAAGQMITAENAARKLAFAYDPRGLLTAETQDDLTITHAYSARGQRTATVLPDGRFVKFGYDADGDFTSLAFLDREVLSLRRDQLGRERARTAGAVAQQMEYDPQGRITQQQAHRKGARTPLFARSYSYDAAGLLTERRDAARGTQRYQYDSREQLRGVLGDGAEQFAFDPAGVILGEVASPADASVRGGRLMMQGDNHFAYDDAGNRITQERGWGGINRFDYEYDHNNQLIAVSERAPKGLRRTEYRYDALGRRICKSYREEAPRRAAANDTPATVPQAEHHTWFLWNGEVLLAEGEGDAHGAVDPLAVVYIYEPDSFRPAAQIRRVNAKDAGDLFIYWLDHLGTPQEITNESGELVWQVALKAWGGIDRLLVDAVGNNLRFQGQYHDVETGLHYNRFRHYDPAVGCFINQDPVGLLGGEISALYAPNPMVWVDPFGLNRWHDWLRANPGQTTTQASAGYRAAYPPPPPSTGAVHGNSHASTRPTVGYIIRENGTGRVLKFGETSNPNPQARYTQKWYQTNNAYMDPVKSGTKAQMHKWQSDRIRQYENRRGVKPPMNKCYY